MNTNKSKFLLFAVATSFFMAGCGGGGSIPIGPQRPLMVTSPDLQVTVPAPPYAAGSDALAAFNYVNDFRSSLGLGKLAYNAALEKTAFNHANYIDTNNFASHSEDATKPKFTGVTPSDRARFAGYSTNNFVTEDIAYVSSYLGAMQRLIDTIYHRTTFTTQSYRDFGFNRANPCLNTCQDGGFSIVVNISSITPQRNASDFVTSYPVNGQTGITLSMGYESPFPFPEVNVDDALRLVGYPIYIAVERSQVLTVTSFTVTEDAQPSNQSAWLLTNGNDPNLIVQPNEAFLTAKGALKPLTKYNVKFNGTANGKPISRSWSFTTAAGHVVYP